MMLFYHGGDLNINSTGRCVLREFLQLLFPQGVRWHQFLLGWGVLERPTKSQDIFIVLTPELLWSTLKVTRDLVTGPPFFFLNDAPGDSKSKHVNTDQKSCQSSSRHTACALYLGTCVFLCDISIGMVLFGRVKTRHLRNIQLQA